MDLAGCTTTSPATASATLPPSLFIDSSSSSMRSSSISATASDLDNLMSMNDSSLSQQIEFILQDASEISGDRSPPMCTTSATLSALASVSNRLSLDASGFLVNSSSSMPSSPQIPLNANSPNSINSHQNIVDGEENIENENEDIEDDVMIKAEPMDDDMMPLNSSIERNESQIIRHSLSENNVKIERMDDDEEDLEYTTEIVETSNGIAAFASTVSMEDDMPLDETNSQMLPLSVQLNENESNSRIVSTSSVLARESQPAATATFVRVPALVNVINKCPTTQISNSICTSLRRGNIITAQETHLQHPTNMTLLNVVQQPTTSVVVVQKEQQHQLKFQEQSRQLLQTVASSLSSSSPPSSSSSSSSSSVVVSSTTGTSTSEDLAQTSAATTATSTTTTTTTTTIYQCVECIDRFDSLELYEIHRSGHVNNMKCAICNMVLKSLKNYEKHCLRCKPYECQICGRVVRFRPNFIKHMRVHTGQQSERHKYKCDVCHKEFMSFEYFKVHKKIHNENVNLTCEICGKVFSALASLRGHSKLHSGVKLHKCDVCGKGFGQRYNLKIHARTHTGDFPFECKICQKKLHTQSSLQTHMQTHQRDQTSQVNTTIKYEQQAQQQQPHPKALETTIAQNIAIDSQDLDENAQMFDTSSSSSSSITTAVAAAKRKSTSRTITIANGNAGVALLQATVTNNNISNVSTTTRSTNTIYNTTEESSDESNSVFTPSNEDRFQHSRLSQPQQQQQQHPVTRTIVIKNYVQTEPHSSQVTTQYAQQQQQHQLLLQREQEEQELELQQHQLSQIQNQTAQQYHLNSNNNNNNNNNNNSNNNNQNHQRQQQQTNYNQQLQQQLRKTPIILSTGGATNLSSSLVSVLTSNTIANSSTTVPSLTSSSAMLCSSTSPPLSLSSAPSPLSSTPSPCSSTVSRSPILASSSSASISTKLRNTPHSIHNPHRHHHNQHHHNQHHHNQHHHHHQHHHNRNIHQCTNEDDDDKSSPSLATTAIIKVEPNLYSSGDNSVDMLIKEEIFDDCSAPSSHSPPTSKYHPTFESDLVPYGSLFEPNSIPDSIPANIYADDDDFRLDNSSLGGLQPTSTTDGDFIKKEWVYGVGTGYTINGKFDEDSAALCDASSFIYN